MFKITGRRGSVGSRRDLPRVLGGASAAMASDVLTETHASVPPVPAVKSSALDFLSLETREVGFENRHTGERLVAAYFDGGRYTDDALSTIAHLMRDIRNNQEHPVDSNMLDILIVVHGQLASSAPIVIISGYRSPAANTALAAQDEAIAKNSFNLYGQAVDVRLADGKASEICRVTINVAAGGTGLYARSNFVHTESGPVRT